jgi:hypothetical protein
VKKPERLEKELSKLSKERGKVQRDFDERMGRVGEEKDKASLKDVEEAAMRKILWLLIRRVDASEVMSPAYKEYEDQVSSKVDTRYAGSSAR